jgi:beta-galactosidase
MEWFGAGPHDAYRDRCAGNRIARYAASVRERYVPYIMPQEHGNITDLRWLALRRSDGRGLLALAPQPIEGKATLVSDECLWAARHTTDVAFLDAPQLHLDVAQRGLGTGSCGPDTLPQYRLTAGAHRLAYVLAPLEPGEDAGAVRLRLLGG